MNDLLVGYWTAARLDIGDDISGDVTSLNLQLGGQDFLRPLSLIPQFGN